MKERTKTVAAIGFVFGLLWLHKYPVSIQLFCIQAVLVFFCYGDFEMLDS
jgi:hypothetical protein